MYITKQIADQWLHKIIDMPLCYGMKSPDLDLFDLGFGNVHLVNDANFSRELCDITLHATCQLKLIHRTEKHCIEKYDADTPFEEFNENIKKIVGRRVQRLELSSKNDLWLDFGEYWMVFITFEDEKESWRIFNLADNPEHLVSSAFGVVLRTIERGGTRERGQGDGSVVSFGEQDDQT